MIIGSFRKPRHIQERNNHDIAEFYSFLMIREIVHLFDCGTESTHKMLFQKKCILVLSLVKYGL